MADTLEDSGLAEAFHSALNGTVAEPEATPEPTPEPVVATPTPEPTSFNPSEYLRTATEGLFDNEETFKAALPKIKNYDDLETKLRDAESKVPKFANDETKVLYEAWANGDKDAVVNYIRESTKDYHTMSDIDVVRESLAKKNPNWTTKDVELELRAEYGKQLEMVDLNTISQEDEPEAYEKALNHNDRVEENLLRLQRAARDSRISLIDQQSKIELPKIAKAEAPVQSNALTDQEIADRQKAWERSVEENLPKISNFKMNIDDKEVEYVRTEAEKKDLADYMKSFNIFKFAKENGWTNEDGTPNPLRIAEDVDYLRNREKQIKSFATQVKTDATKDALKKIKNIDEPGRTVADTEPSTLEEAYARARGW